MRSRLRPYQISNNDMVFNNKYMKLFDARPNTIRTFGLRFMQLLPASNIEVSVILETPSYINLPPWCIRPRKIVKDLKHLNGTDSSIYQQLFVELRDRYCDYISVYTYG